MSALVGLVHGAAQVAMVAVAGVAAGLAARGAMPASKEAVGRSDALKGTLPPLKKVADFYRAVSTVLLYIKKSAP
jgi:hypothetical protein